MYLHICIYVLLGHLEQCYSKFDTQSAADLWTTYYHQKISPKNKLTRPRDNKYRKWEQLNTFMYYFDISTTAKLLAL